MGTLAEERDSIMSSLPQDANSEQVAEKQENEYNNSDDGTPDPLSVEIPESEREGLAGLKNARDVLKAYRELQSIYGKHSNEVGDLRKMITEMQQKQSSLTQSPMLSAEEQDRMMRERLADKPFETIDERAKRIAEERLNPIDQAVKELRGEMGAIKARNEYESFVKNNDISPEIVNEMNKIYESDSEKWSKYGSISQIMEALYTTYQAKQYQAMMKKNALQDKRQKVVSPSQGKLPTKAQGNEPSLEELRELAIRDTEGYRDDN